MMNKLTDEAVYAKKKSNKAIQEPSKYVEPKTVASKVAEPKAVPKQLTDKDGFGRAYGAEHDIYHYRQHAVHSRDEGRRSERLV